MEFTSSELCDATKSYNKKCVVGQGGFGKVYKGTLRGSLSAAIKVLSPVSIYITSGFVSYDY